MSPSPVVSADGRKVTLRRILQQAEHCVAEALAVVENDEDDQCAKDDVQHAVLLLQQVLTYFNEHR